MLPSRNVGLEEIPKHFEVRHAWAIILDDHRAASHCYTDLGSVLIPDCQYAILDQLKHYPQLPLPLSQKARESLTVYLMDAIYIAICQREPDLLCNLCERPFLDETEDLFTVARPQRMQHAQVVDVVVSVCLCFSQTQSFVLTQELD
jgi:hypothetical protein